MPCQRYKPLEWLKFDGGSDPFVYKYFDTTPVDDRCQNKISTWLRWGGDQPLSRTGSRFGAGSGGRCGQSQVLRGGLKAELIELVLQIAAADTEQLSRLRLNAACLYQRRPNELSFVVIEQFREWPVEAQ